MKKTKILAFILITIIALTAVAGWVYWKQLRGSSPAFRDSTTNIADLIDTANQSNANVAPNSNQRLEPGKNNTDFPLAIPDGFTFSVFARGLDKPRDLVLDPNGVIIVSDTDTNRVLALPDKNTDNIADETKTIVEGLTQPHGLAVRCPSADDCKLFVAATNQVVRYDYDATEISVSNAKKILDLPTGGNHYTRSLQFLPAPNDHRLLVAIGSTCNVCNEADERRAAIVAVNDDGTEAKLYATGLRNTVFMAEHPVTHEIWGTDMGRDLIGDDIPPEEVNIIEEGNDYGWPYCYGKNTHDDAFDKNKSQTCAEPQYTPAHIEMQAHSAPLGISFFSDNWSPTYAHDMLVVFHGSWNRTVPTGYKIVRYQLDDQGNVQSSSDFVSGWLVSAKESLGRPADVLITEDKKIFISDDKAGLVYVMTQTQ